MAEFVDDDQDVKEKDDFEKRDDGKEERRQPLMDAERNEKETDKPDKAPEAKVEEEGAFRRRGRRHGLFDGDGSAAIHEERGWANAALDHTFLNITQKHTGL
jgi:hypothetical protein